jgi:UrcA family protein
MTSLTTRSTESRRRSAVLTAVSACLMLLGAAAAVQAAPASDAAPSVKVAYGDLNLAGAEGNNTLYARIVAAARQVCNVNDVDTRDLRGMAAAKACQTRAISQAVSAVHSPQLAAIYSARQGRG